MPLTTRAANRNLGTYFAIFASAFIALAVLALIFEELGASLGVLQYFVLFAPVMLLYGVGAAGYTRNCLDFFAAGRRVPAVYCGLGMSITGLGATGVVTIAGALYVMGFDALFLLNGALAGFVLMSVLLAPYLRKFGSFTVTTYLGRRFDNRALRMVSAALLAVPILLFLVAEFVIASKAGAWLTGQTPSVVIAFVASVVSAVLVVGAMRSLAWTNVACAIVAMIALGIPLAVVTVLSGYLPFPQLSSGPILRAVGRAEAVEAIPIVIQSSFFMELPADGLQAAAKRFAEPFGAIGPVAFVMASLTVAFGVAGSPWLIPRMATTPSVYDARKSLGWATLFLGFLVVTVASVAFLMRYKLIQLGGISPDLAPDWLRALVAAGFAEITDGATALGVTTVALDRDSILMALPISAGLPDVFGYLTASAIVIAATGGAAAAALTLANMISEDVIHGLNWKPRADGVRFATVRIAMLAVVGIAALAAAVIDSDPLKLLLWALAINGAVLFPVLVLSIWWKRITTAGAFASLLTGFVATLAAIMACETGVAPYSSALSGIVAVPASFIAAFAVSGVTGRPSRHALELVRDIRIPGGEILYDREMRLLRLKELRRS